MGLGQGGSLEGPTALPAGEIPSPLLKGALDGAALCPPHALTFEKQGLCVRLVLGCIHICYITQLSQHCEVQVVFCILRTRKLGLCLFFLMKTQHGAIFHRWPTTWGSLVAYIEEESQLFIGECQKFGLDVLLLTSSCTLGNHSSLLALIPSFIETAKT